MPQPLFPTKSRLQVSIALEKLLEASTNASVAALHHAFGDSDDLTQAATFIQILCNRRLSTLLRAVVWPQVAEYRLRSLRHDSAATVQSLLIIRGWRRRWPRALDLPRKD